MKKLLFGFLLFSLFAHSQFKIIIVNPPKDYHKHFWGSTLISGFTTSSVYYVTRKKWVSVLSGITASLGLGYFKERFLDKSFSNNDFQADYSGTVTTEYSLSMSLIKYFKQDYILIDTLKYTRLAPTRSHQRFQESSPALR